MKNLILKSVISPILVMTLITGMNSMAFANTKKNMQNELDKEIAMALNSSNTTTTTTRRVVRKTSPTAKVKKFDQRSIHSFVDSSNNIDRIKSEVGTSNQSKRTSSYEEMMNSTTTSLSADDAELNISSAKKFGFNVFTFFSGAQNLYTSGNSLSKLQNNSSLYNSTAFTSGEYTSTGSYGFGLEHSRTDMIFASKAGLGYAIGLTYEADRELDRGYTDSQGKSVTSYLGFNGKTAIENPTLSLVLPYANVMLTYKNTYYLVGLNYSVPQMANADDEIYEGAIGYQVGAGMDIGDYLALEATYRWVSFTASTRIIDPFIQSHQRSGLGLLADEDFALDGLNVNLKLRF
jgi:hypothetical protein